MSADWSTAVSSWVVYIPPPGHTFQFRLKKKKTKKNLKNTTRPREAGWLHCSSTPKERDGGWEGGGVQGVTLVSNLPPILRLGCTFPELPATEAAGPTVRLCFAADDGNMEAASREWTSQSGSATLRRPPPGNSCDVRAH